VRNTIHNARLVLTLLPSNPRDDRYLRFEYDLKKSKELMKGGIQWHTLMKDPFSGKCGKGEIPGFMQASIQFGERKKLPMRGGWPATRKANYLLRAHIYQGKGLPAADAEGTSDAYLVIRMAGQVDFLLLRMVGGSSRCLSLSLTGWQDSRHLRHVFPSLV